MARIEPTRHELEEWALGYRNMCFPVVNSHANWAYWYLGYDDPDFYSGDILTNIVIVRLTEACSLRLKELDDV